MKLTNKQIYEYAQALAENFSNRDQYLPILINFSIQKNKSILMPLAEEIETLRLGLAQTYGTYNEEDSMYTILSEDMEKAQKELDNLFEIEQEVNLWTMPLSKVVEFNPSLSSGQMEALIFMIDGDA